MQASGENITPRTQYLINRTETFLFQSSLARTVTYTSTDCLDGPIKQHLKPPENVGVTVLQDVIQFAMGCRGSFTQRCLSISLCS